MIPDIVGKEHSFAGAGYFCDKRQPGDAKLPVASERVAWTEVRNLPVENPPCHAVDDRHHERDRGTAGQASVKATSRRSGKAVYAFSLALG